ncbi:MAG TPA: hypothetical protein VIE65_15960, partial [Methylobacter sp.]
TFIDGLHTFDQALKDFINAERFSNKRSVALFHDILPTSPLPALRKRETKMWVGDTWKVMIILKKFRPDLQIMTIPTFPSGLGVVTNMDASSTLLHDSFDRICEEAMAYELDSYQPQLNQHLNVVENDFDAVAQRLDPVKK